MQCCTGEAGVVGGGGHNIVARRGRYLYAQLIWKRCHLVIAAATSTIQYFAAQRGRAVAATTTTTVERQRQILEIQSLIPIQRYVRVR